MSIYFYTIMHKGKEYSLDARIYSMKKLSEKLGIKRDCIRRGADMLRAPQLTDEVLREMRAAAQAPE